MTINRFRLNITLRILVLLLTASVFIFLIVKTQFYILIAALTLVIAYQIYSVVIYVERLAGDLKRFLESIRYSDFSQSFVSRGQGGVFNDLNESFTRVIDEFRKARQEKEESYRYLQTIVQHIGTGLITYDSIGEVSIINNAAKKLLKISSLKNIASLSGVSLTLVETLYNIKSGEKALVKVVDNNELLQLSITATEFRMNDRSYKMVTIANIQSELEEKEMEAWQKLIRVLTHEIMNSITPISSIAQTTNNLLHGYNPGSENIEDFEDIKLAIQTIQRRSEGLIHFVNNYRSLTKIPKPNFSIVPIENLFAQINKLMKDQLKGSGIEFKCSVNPKTLELTIDPSMIEQVLINLIVNSIHALKGRPDPKIEMKACLEERGRTIIQVKDNGAGMLEEVQEKIFIPFFTTKKEGSGIGLSLSRQIMRQHGGNIQVQSRIDVGTVFTLFF